MSSDIDTCTCSHNALKYFLIGFPAFLGIKAYLSDQPDNEANTTMYHHSMNAGGPGLTFPGYSNLALEAFPQPLGYIDGSGVVGPGGHQTSLLELSGSSFFYSPLYHSIFMNIS